MVLRDLFRTPLGIATTAFAVVVIGVAIAAYLLNVPLFLVLGGTIVVATVGFWLITRREPGTQPPESEAPKPQG
jgi:hypothetical protein